MPWVILVPFALPPTWERWTMPVHDWTKVRPGTFHDFHGSWMTHLKETLNGGLLPSAYYALAEQPAEEAWPDVLALEAADPEFSGGGWPDRDPGGELRICRGLAPAELARWSADCALRRKPQYLPLPAELARWKQ